MSSFRYRYAIGSPPSPSVLLNLTHPVTGQRVEDVPAIVDAGADQTVIPERLILELGLIQLDQQLVRGFDGSPRLLPTFLTRIQVRDLPRFDLEIIASPAIENAILGRDVLNRYKVVLDGPGQVMTISDESSPPSRE